MKEIAVNDYARRLYGARGGKAEAIAAQNALDRTEKGDETGADQWRRIRIAIKEMRGRAH